MNKETGQCLKWEHSPESQKCSGRLLPPLLSKVPEHMGKSKPRTGVFSSTDHSDDACQDEKHWRGRGEEMEVLNVKYHLPRQGLPLLRALYICPILTM